MLKQLILSLLADFLEKKNISMQNSEPDLLVLSSFSLETVPDSVHRVCGSTLEDSLHFIEWQVRCKILIFLLFFFSIAIYTMNLLPVLQKLVVSLH